MHREADARSINRQKLKRKVEEEELESYPFKPSINRRSEEMLDMSHYKPIHLRVNDIQRAKHASRLAERLSRDASNPNLTFQPKINETSKQVKKKEDNQKKTKAKKNQNFVLGTTLFFCCVLLAMLKFTVRLNPGGSLTVVNLLVEQILHLPMTYFHTNMSPMLSFSGMY